MGVVRVARGDWKGKKTIEVIIFGDFLFIENIINKKEKRKRYFLCIERSVEIFHNQK